MSGPLHHYKKRASRSDVDGAVDEHSQQSARERKHHCSAANHVPKKRNPFHEFDQMIKDKYQISDDMYLKMSYKERNKRLKEMLTFTELVDRWYSQMLNVPRPRLVALIKLGEKIVSFLPTGRAK